MTEIVESLSKLQEELAEKLSSPEQVNYKISISKAELLLNMGRTFAEYYATYDGVTSDTTSLLAGFCNRIDTAQGDGIYISVIGQVKTNLSIIINQSRTILPPSEYPSFHVARTQNENNAIFFAFDNTGAPPALELVIPDELTNSNSAWPQEYYIANRIQQLPDDQKLIIGTMLLDAIFKTVNSTSTQS